MRAVYLLGTLCCVATLVSGQTISITITGTNSMATPSDELRITCQPSTAGIDDVNTISIEKNSSTSGYTTLVSVSYSKTSASSVINWANTVLQNRQGVSATGNVDSKSAARLDLEITKNNTKCEDGGAYRCNMGVTLTGGSGGVANAEKYITATVLPTYTNTMTVSPTPNVDGIYYSVGTTLTFNCYGTVGSDKREHTWCYKRSTDATFTGYPDNAQNPSINQNNDGLTASGCNFIRSSTLTYNVTSADTSTTFMCEPYTGSFCGGSAANLKTELTIKNYVSNTNTGGQGDSDSTSSAGTIAGAVIGAFAGILLIVLIVYFVVFRRRSSGETYNTKEDGSPESAENGGPAHTEGPVYSVPDKNRSRGKHGHDNNAMDEPREERRKRRDQRDQRDHRDRHDYDDGRGHSNKAMYDYSDDGDGDIRGSLDGGGHPVGIGSAV